MTTLHRAHDLAVTVDDDDLADRLTQEREAADDERFERQTDV